MKCLLLTLCLALFCSAPPASNLQRERQTADQLISLLNIGESHWLGTAERPFLALHLQPSTHKTLGGVILLHDLDANPDATKVIQPLRTYLAAKGWETLSIQLPVAAQHAGLDAYRPLITEAMPRIQFAVDFFTSRQNQNLVLLGHGMGARAGLAYLAKNPAPAIRAFVAIGLAGGVLTDQQPQLDVVGKLNIPMFDLLGSRDLESVIRNAKQRQLAAKRSGQNAYRQHIVTGADHNFTGLEQDLQFRVGAWLVKTAAGMELDDTKALTPPASTL